MLTLSLNTGRRIPAIAFGTGTSFFGRGDDVAALVEPAYQAGFSCYDTAVIYGTEEGLGKGLAQLPCDRSSLFILSKSPDWAWTREEVVKEVEKSVMLMNLDYIDLFLLHTPAPRKEGAFIRKALTEDQIDRLPDPQNAEVMETARFSAWQGLEECVERGLVRDIGVSNFTVHHLQQLITKKDIKIRPCVNQVELNPYQTDTKMYNFCKQEGILLQAFGPLGNGKEMLADPVLMEIANKKEKTVAQACLRWAFQLGVATVTKTEKTSRMKENLSIWDFELDQEEMVKISGLNKNIRIFGDYTRFP